MPSGNTKIREAIEIALKHQREGRLRAAGNIYRRVLQIQPENPDALHFLGVIAHKVGRADLATELLGRSIAAAPSRAGFHVNLGNVYLKQQKVDAAIACYRQAIIAQPASASAHTYLAAALARRGKLLEASRIDLDGPSLEGQLFAIPKDETELIEATACEPSEAAEESFELDDDAPLVESLGPLNLAVVPVPATDVPPVDTSARFDIEAAATTIATRSGIPGEGHAQVLAGRLDSAGDGEAGIAGPPDHPSAELPSPPGTSALRFPPRHAAAPASRRPPSAESLRRRGAALVGVRRIDEAIPLLNRAVALRPKFAEAHRDLGGALLRRGDLEGAIVSLKRALHLRPSFADAWGSLGDAYQLAGDISQAIRCYRRLLDIVPDAAKVHSNVLLSMNYDPGSSAEQVFKEHLHWAARHADRYAREILPHANDRTPHRRLKIGYVSPDFRKHSVNYFAEPILAGHYRRYFHVTCYSDALRADGVTLWLAELSDNFRDTHAMDDEQVARQVRADAIDILVDLSGHTGNNRLGTFARKPAPVQVTYLGYPNTTGLSTIDYRITDALADPPGQTEHLYREHLVRLPETFLCYQPPPSAPDVGPLPRIVAGHVTFGCFNILAKITDEVIALWASIMRELPNSRLLLKGRNSPLSNATRRQHVLDVFATHGITSDRIELLGKVSNSAQHLSHYRRLDIALDPFPYNGTTTTCEALWMGLPVITLAGDRHVSRVGVSILTNAGLPEMIAGTPDHYVRIATALAGSPKDLSRLRATLRERMLCSPLTDSIRLTRALEAEYRNMWVHWCRSEQTVGRPARRA